MKYSRNKRIERLLQIVIEIKTSPKQKLDQLWEKLGVSRSQFYKDKETLAELGFVFEYSRRQKQFIITQDAYLPVANLTLSERLSLIMAFRQLSAAGDYVLTYDGFNAAKKLAAELPSPLRDSFFEDIVLRKGFGCAQEVLEKLQKAIRTKQRVKILYLAPDQHEPADIELEPFQIFFKRRALYVEGFAWHAKAIRMFRLNRIKTVQLTPLGFTVRNDYDFGKRHKNAFSVFPGETVEHVVIRFSKKIRPYIEESLWHHSQVIKPQNDGSILFEVYVAAPREVLWWVLGWGAEAEILKPDWLREEARKTVCKMCRNYGMMISE